MYLRNAPGAEIENLFDHLPLIAGALFAVGVLIMIGLVWLFLVRTNYGLVVRAGVRDRVRRPGDGGCREQAGGGDGRLPDPRPGELAGH